MDSGMQFQEIKVTNWIPRIEYGQPLTMDEQFLFSLKLILNIE